MNCWEILIGNAKDNQQPSPNKREGSTTNSILYNNSSYIEEMKKILKDRLNENGRNLLIAAALGDGCINKEGQILINHSWKQRDYCLWKRDLLKKNGIKVGKIQRYEGTNGYLKYTIQYRFCVGIHIFNKVLRRVLYDMVTRKKYPRKILNRLSQQGLALWFMDDGALLRRKYKGKYCGFYLRISTYCSSEQADTIIKYFNEEWNIFPTKIHESKIKSYDAYTINFGAKEGKKLINIIKPYMCPSMMYKVLYDIEELKSYYNIQEVSEILTKSTLESDRLLVEAHTTSFNKK